MRHFINRRIFFACIPLFFAFDLSAQCVNGDLEMNNLNGWSKFLSFNTTGIPDVINATATTLGAPRFSVQNTGFDPIIGGSVLPTVFQGSQSLKLGDATLTQGVSAQLVSFDIAVTDGNANFSFAYAMARSDDPVNPHLPNDKSFFQWWISKNNG